MANYKTKYLQASVFAAEAGGWRAGISRKTSSPDPSYSPLVTSEWFATKEEAIRAAKRLKAKYGARSGTTYTGAVVPSLEW